MLSTRNEQLGQSSSQLGSNMKRYTMSWRRSQNRSEQSCFTRWTIEDVVFLDLHLPRFAPAIRMLCTLTQADFSRISLLSRFAYHTLRSNRPHLDRSAVL